MSNSRLSVPVAGPRSSAKRSCDPDYLDHLWVVAREFAVRTYRDTATYSGVEAARQWLVSDPDAIRFIGIANNMVVGQQVGDGVSVDGVSVDGHGLSDEMVMNGLVYRTARSYYDAHLAGEVNLFATN